MSFGDDALFDVFEKEEKYSLNTDTTEQTIQKNTKRPLENTQPQLQNGNRTEKVKGNPPKKSKVEPRNVLHTDVSTVNVERAVPAVGPEAEIEKSVVISHSVRHQVALPLDYPYVPIADHVQPEKPARTYPFTLDPFQQVSVNAIQREESVLVSAHTSAGKTVVAEYAIAQSLANKQRVIYTSPIKALSNQKFREFQAEFGDVGLMTGDVTINPNASCLVMTTEILRSMLYRGSEVMREVAWVVFDEVHYMRDKHRGVVWEETLILLPHKVHYVFLSATIPNAYEFAEWIVKIHDQPCHVVYTDFRPTPLQHYLFPQGGEGIFLAVDEKGVFREDNFSKAMACLGPKDVTDGAGGANTKKKSSNSKWSKGGKTDGPSDIYKIVKMIMTKNYHPVIVFSFNKRECENLALQMSKIDFNDKGESEMVTTVFNNGISSLSEDDRQLPQIEHILPLLRRGIGIHHSGLLPILKEVIEILFQEGLIKVLFATETFSIGLNMPAKTVVFTNVQKWDGTEIRWISGGEYIQMSGRAGRRGLDDRGIVILMLDEKMESAVAKGMVKGEADALNSAFHLGYNMILNLLRVEGISPEFMLERSFFQFQSGKKVPAFQTALDDAEDEYQALVIPDEAVIGQLWDIRRQLDQFNQDMRDVINHPNHCLQYMQPGRLVRVKSEDGDFGWGVVVNYQKRVARNKNGPIRDDSVSYVVDVLLHCTTSSELKIDATSGVARGAVPANEEKGEMKVVACLLSSLDGISLARVFMPKDLRRPDDLFQVYRSIQEVKKRFKDAVPILDPVENMNIKDKKFLELIERIKVLEQRLADHPMQNSPELPELYNAYTKKMELKDRIRDARSRLMQAESVLQLEELKGRKRVLRRLGYTTQADVIEMKGRVACEISSGDELMLTEMMFNGVFNDLSIENTVALLSCFVFDEKTNKEQTQTIEELVEPLRIMQETARRIAKVSQESKLSLDEDEYVQTFKPDLMEAVLAWCNGAKFSQICKMTDVFEGSIIRVMRRLEELLRQMAVAAKSIGNTQLENKFMRGIEKIKRDIIFAASLYL